VAKFRKKPIIVEATQWFKNGDHPEDNLPPASKIVAGERTEGAVVRYFRLPDFSGREICNQCNHTFHEHGWIDDVQGGHMVCPGDWIITEQNGEQYYPCKPDAFEATYERVDE
jgi:hypothetical protein